MDNIDITQITSDFDSAFANPPDFTEVIQRVPMQRAKRINRRNAVRLSALAAFFLVIALTSTALLGGFSNILPAKGGEYLPAYKYGDVRFFLSRGEEIHDTENTNTVFALYSYEQYKEFIDDREAIWGFYGAEGYTEEDFDNNFVIFVRIHVSYDFYADNLTLKIKESGKALYFLPEMNVTSNEKPLYYDVYYGVALDKKYSDYKLVAEKTAVTYETSAPENTDNVTEPNTDLQWEELSILSTVVTSQQYTDRTPISLSVIDNITDYIDFYNRALAPFVTSDDVSSPTGNMFNTEFFEYNLLIVVRAASPDCTVGVQYTDDAVTIKPAYKNTENYLAVLRGDDSLRLSYLLMFVPKTSVQDRGFQFIYDLYD